MSRIRPLVCLNGMLVVLLVLASFGLECGAQTKDQAVDGLSHARYGGVYRAPLLNNPPTLDPAYVQDIYAIAVVQQLFDGLVQFTPDLYIAPALAENWQVEEQGKTYRFFLRKNARFHNGQPVTSKDVVFSLMRLLRASPPPTILPHLLKIDGAKDYAEQKTSNVSGLVTVDDHTLLIHLEQPYVPFLIALGMYQAKVVPSEIVSQEAGRFGREPIGSGPFKFMLWEENKLIKLQSNSDYHTGRPLLDAIEYLIYPGIEIEQVWGDFEKGKLEEMPVYAQIRQRLDGNKEFMWIHRPSLSLQFYGVNCQHPKLRNPQLRKALSMAIDRERLVLQAYNGQFEAARSILPPGLPGYHPHSQRILEDVAEAGKYLSGVLEESSQRKFAIEIVSNSKSPFAQAELNLMREFWSKLGIELEIKFVPDWSEFEQYLKSDSLQLYRYAWFADMPDPDDFLRPLFTSDSQFNFARYQDPDVDDMLQRAIGIVDPVERAQMYQTIEDRILTSLPIIPLIYLSIDVVYQPTVQGIQVSALGAHTMSYHRVWLKNASKR